MTLDQIADAAANTFLLDMEAELSRLSPAMQAKWQSAMNAQMAAIEADNAAEDVRVAA